MTARIRIAFLALALIAANLPASAQEASTPKNGLSFELGGGFRWTAIGDIRDHIDALDEYLYDLCGSANYLPGHLRQPGPYGPDLDFTLRLELGCGFSAAAGAGFSRILDRSESLGVFFLYQDPTIHYRTVATFLRTDIRLVPVHVDVSYRWALARDLSLTLGAGAVACFASVDLERSLNFYPLTYNPAEGIVWPHLDDSFEVSGIGFGPLGKLGLEFRASRSLTLLVLVEGRYARVTRLKGRQAYSYDSWIDEGYYVEGENEGFLQTGTSDRSLMGLSEDVPDLSVTPSPTMRQARFDLGGISCRLGVRLRLF